MATTHSRGGLTAFTAGLLSPKLAGRTDVAAYLRGCSKLVNFLLMRQGGLRRRPGTIFVANGHTGADPASDNYDYMRRHRLIPFVVNETMGYVLEATPHWNASATNTIWRVFYYHSLAATINMGLSLSDVYDMQYTQVQQTMFLASRNMPVHKLTYVSAASWTVSIFAYRAGSVVLNTAGNYPGCVAFKDGRLILASTTNNPHSVWGSAVGSITDFVLGSTADTCWGFSIGGRKAPKIEWVEAQDELVIGTGMGECIAVGSVEEGVTPAKGFFKWRSAWGVAPTQPKIFQNGLVFIQKGGMQAREYFWEDGAKSPELTMVADQVAGDFLYATSSVATADIGWVNTDRGFVELEVQESPEPILWFVRRDGKLAAMVYDKAAQVAGWSEMEFTGYPGAPTVDNQWFGEAKVGSTCVIPNTAGEEELWLYMMRWTASTADIAYRTQIEYMAPSEYANDEDGHFVDCGVDTTVSAKANVVALTPDTSTFTFTHQGSAFLVSADTIRFEDISQDSTWKNINRTVYTISSVASSIYTIGSMPPSAAIAEMTSYDVPLGKVMKVTNSVSGLSHLEGFTVAVNVDGMAIADKVVSGGAVSLATVYGNRIHAGLPYTSKMKTMDLGTGPNQGAMGKISEVVVRLWKSLGGKIGKDEDEELEDIKIKRVGTGAVYGTEPHYSGDVAIGFPAGYSRSRFVYIEQSQPLPMYILAIIPEVYTYNKG